MLFTSALNILLKWLEMGVWLITQVNYFSNTYKLLMNIIDKNLKCVDLKNGEL